MMRGLRLNGFTWIGRAIVMIAMSCLVSLPTKAVSQQRPTLFIVGDSTVKNGTQGQRGWGEEIGAYFDSTKVAIENHAIGGRSSRTFQTEGRWDRILQKAQAGDYVLIQLGHNDSGLLDDPQRSRGTLPGIGEEVREIDNPISKRKETVHTYGWYLRKYISDARQHSLIPVLVSPVPRVPRQTLATADGMKSGHIKWCQEVAEAEKVPFIDLNQIVLRKYVGLAPAEIQARYFTPADGTHTNVDGAKLNAQGLAEGIRDLKELPLRSMLRPI